MIPIHFITQTLLGRVLDDNYFTRTKDASM